MSVQTRIEEFALAPDDRRWGDERARDEYYRGAALAYWWMQYVLLIVMVVAAAQGALWTSVVVLLGVLSGQWVCQGYCRRRGIPLASLTKEFNSGGRRWIALGSVLPFLVLWAVFVLRERDALDTASLVGAVCGAIVGGLFAMGMGLWIRRREQRDIDRLAGDDDRFE
ncbi:hypothetical protein P0W64_19855 [Tsukamurella sp. 8F]|uniref:hypothetical protein n=1 Tax=unclassified Tsukamurella TaxID=2633480 RepID=UPI0023BA3A15|nr:MULTISPECIES: hypothetical protein [unclassified Tsukamurella]MDF0531801.1 hypothetical protein [Tsukamurella sp. 8J]MDF0589043.1 hypothetical protein [Tsukamurella sp. 8F]